MEKNNINSIEINDVAKHIETTKNNIEKGNVIFDVTLLKNFIGDLANDYTFRLCLESDPTSALVFVMYIATQKMDEHIKTNELLELKSFIHQTISHAHFLTKASFQRTNNLIEKIVIGFKEIYFELREPRVYFLNKILLLIDKDLNQIYLRETQIIVDKKPSIFETRNVWGLFIAIQKKVGILPNNNTLLANQFAPLLGFDATKLSQVITSDKKYRNHEINIDDLEIIEDAINEMSSQIQKLKLSKK